MLRWNKTASAFVIVACGWSALGTRLPAQPPAVHYRNHAAMPPGAIGSWQVLQRGGPLRGYFQPVEIVAPSGAQVALAAQGQFERPSVRVNAGLLIGQVYRMRVTGIPLHMGEEVFPTLEVIDRTYPPPGRTEMFPITVELAQQDLELALEGKFVTRVIYLEDPQAALPVRRDPRAQEWFDVPPGEDPLQVADVMGRPMAILRMGSRAPIDPTRPSAKFLYGSPPFQRLRPAPWPLPPVTPQPGPPAGQPTTAPPVGNSASRPTLQRPAIARGPSNSNQVRSSR